MSETYEPDLRDQYDSAMWTLLDDVWETWGQVDEVAAAPSCKSQIFPGEIWNPMGIQEPAPASVDQPSFRVIRRPEGLAVASYGLSWPMAWDDADPTNGLEVEVYAASNTIPAAETFDAVGSWLGRVVGQIAALASEHRYRFTEQLEHYGTLSTIVSGIDLPPEISATYADDNGDLTVLLGLDVPDLPTRITGPLSTIRMVNIKILTPAEAEFCVNGPLDRTEARGELVRLLGFHSGAMWSNPGRVSVV